MVEEGSKVRVGKLERCIQKPRQQSIIVQDILQVPQRFTGVVV